MPVQKTEWSPDFDLGVPEIDKEHRELFNLVGAVGGAIEERDYRLCRLLSLQFVTALDAHFTNEEAILARIDFPGAREHQALHAAIKNDARALIEACDAAADGKLVATCYERMMACLMDDVVRCDHELKSYAEVQGRKQRDKSPR
jgi:hemerythrin